MTDSTDSAALVTAARQGNRAAFGELTRRYRPRIYALALHLTGSTHDADDVAQETFLRAYNRLAEFRAASEFYTWVYRIAVNLALNVKRAHARRRTTSMDDPRVALAVQVDALGDPRRQAELREVYTRLLAALDALPEAMSSTVVLVALQGLTHEQAGAILNCSPGTIAWRIHEARERLHAALEPATPAAARAVAFIPAFT
jgi:RNA polymerase sigma-70 factor, ECF subfamily